MTYIWYLIVCFTPGDGSFNVACLPAQTFPSSQECQFVASAYAQQRYVTRAICRGYGRRKEKKS